MAEGGYFPWKVQKIWSRGPAVDYNGLRVPLPNPPNGMEWHQDSSTREWKLIHSPQETTMSSTDQEIPRNQFKHQHQLNVIEIDCMPELTGIPSVTARTTTAHSASEATPEEEWEVLSDGDKACFSNNSAGAIFVSKAGSVQSLDSIVEGTNAAGYHNSFSSSHTSLTQVSVPYKIKRTHSNSTIDSCENLGPSGKGILGVDYVEHVVLPTDTMQGICLAYKVNSTRLRQANHFSGNNLILAPKKLVIPISKKAMRSGFIRVQDTDANEFKLHALLAEFPDLSMTEAKAYLELSDWVLTDAIRSAREDNEWEHEMDTAAGLRSGEIRITLNKNKDGKVGFHTFGAGLCKQLRHQSATKSSVAPLPSTNLAAATKKSTGYHKTAPAPQLVDYHAMPAIATKTVKAHDVYKAGAQQGHLGVELQPLTKAVKHAES